ncbi:MAG: DUF1697 domain-containing protein [Acidobacteriota bacterium]
MPVFIALLRGINVGGHQKVVMAELEKLCQSLGLRDVRTHLQSGNVVFRTTRSDRAKLTRELESALAIQAKVILRSAEELRNVIAANPMTEESQSDPSHYVVVFLSGAPSAEAMKSLVDSYDGPEKMQLHGAELYLHYGQEMARSKLSNALLERRLGVSATARNWNTVTRLLTIADEMAPS